MRLTDPFSGGTPRLWRIAAELNAAATVVRVHFIVT